MFRLIRTQYRSLSTFQVVQEIHRCNEEFFGKPRYDSVLIKYPDGSYGFARLLLVFQCTALGQTWSLARVAQFFTHTTPKHSRTGMRLIQLESKGSFIDVSWIVRSVYMSPTYDPETKDQLFYANDQVKDHSTGDQFLRLGAIDSNLS